MQSPFGQAADLRYLTTSCPTLEARSATHPHRAPIPDFASSLVTLMDEGLQAAIVWG